MITALLVISAIGLALFLGLVCGAGLTLAVHQREFATYKADMDDALRSRDEAMAHLLNAVQLQHQDLEGVIAQTSGLTQLNSKILSALCKSSAADNFGVTYGGQKH